MSVDEEKAIFYVGVFDTVERRPLVIEGFWSPALWSRRYRRLARRHSDDPTVVVTGFIAVDEEFLAVDMSPVDSSSTGGPGWSPPMEAGLGHPEVTEETMANREEKSEPVIFDVTKEDDWPARRRLRAEDRHRDELCRRLRELKPGESLIIDPEGRVEVEGPPSKDLATTDGQDGMKKNKRWMAWAHPVEEELSELFLGVFDDEDEAKLIADEAWVRVQDTHLGSEIGLAVTPVPAVNPARQYVDAWAEEAEGGSPGPVSRRQGLTRWLVWAYPQGGDPSVRFLGVFDHRDEANAVAEEASLHIRETLIESGIGFGVGPVYSGEIAREQILRWVEQIEGIVPKMEGWVQGIVESWGEELRARARRAETRDENPPCPECESKSTVPIVWGYPMQHVFEELERAEEEGRPPPYVLAGCVIESGAPTWHCHECGHQWGRMDVA